MASFLDFIRMRNIYGQPQYGNDLPSQGGITGTLGGEQSGMEGMTDIWGQMGGAPQPTPQPTPQPQSQAPFDPLAAYQPETAATDRYNELLKQYPTREKYKPSVLRRIGGALMAVGSGYANQDPRRPGYNMNPLGVKAGMAFMDEPFTKAQEDWKEQIGPAQQAANLERYENVNRRTVAYNQATEARKQQELELKDANQKARIDIARIKATGVKEFDFKGPTVMAAYPDGRVVDTGIKTGHLSDADKIEANSKAAKSLEETKQENRLELGAYGVPYVMTRKDGSKVLMQMTKEGGFEEVDLPEGATVDKIGGTGKGGKQPSPAAMELLHTQANEVKADIEKLMDMKTKKLTPLGASTTGVTGAVTGYNPFGQSAIGHSTVKKIKDALTLNIIQAIKQASETGATGFGQMNLRELGVLQSAATNLDPKMGDQAMIQELTRIYEKMEKVLQPTDGFTQTEVPKPGETAKDKLNRFRQKPGAK